MAYVGTGYRLYYAAKNYVTGLSDVYYYVYKPSGVKLGPFLMTELNIGIAKGIYYDDFLNADMEGSYLFIANCTSNPKQHEKNVFFEERAITASEKTSIMTNLQFLVDMEGGKWELTEPNDLTFYKSDNVTVVAQFKTYNALGLPSITEITKAERV